MALTVSKLSTFNTFHDTLYRMGSAFRNFFSLMILLCTSALFLLTAIRLAGQILRDKNKKCRGILAYLTSVYSIHLFSYLNLTIHGSMPLFNRPDNILSPLFLISRFSFFVTVPAFIHGLFPHPWTKKVQFAIFVLGVGLFAGSIMEIMPPIGYTIAVYSILVIVGAYAVIHGFISSLHIPAKKYLASNEFRYGLVALISFLISIPFLIPLDLTLIPQGFLDARHAFYPYHSLLLIGGFFIISTIKKGLWLENIPAIPETGEAAIQERDIFKEYGLTARES